MSHNETMAQRLPTALRLGGYWKDDRPDVGRFCREKGYLPQSVYSWLQGVEPRHEALRRLADDLGCSVAWLVAGEEAAAQGQETVVNLASGPGKPPKGVPAARPRPRMDERTFQVFDSAPIRKLREVTTRLEQLEAALQAFFDISPDLLLWLDPRGTIASASHGKEFELTIPLERKIGKRMWDLLPAPIGRLWKEAVAHVRSTGRPYTFEVPITTKGKLRTHECRLVPIKRHGFLAMIRDITELRGLQQKARPRKQRES